ncbi:MAG: response regulator [Cyanobacteria bacterium P01_A01_bin.40]
MNKRHILIIEDDPGIQAVTKFSLEMDGDWLVTVARCGKEGLLKAVNLQPDVILLDLIMPDINGSEILQQLKYHPLTSNIPIILFTAKLIEGEILELKHNNIIGLITKPFDCLILSQMITDIIGNHRHLVCNCGSK